eukprot:776919_1
MTPARRSKFNSMNPDLEKSLGQKPMYVRRNFPSWVNKPDDVKSTRRNKFVAHVKKLCEDYPGLLTISADEFIRLYIEIGKKSFKIRALFEFQPLVVNPSEEGNTKPALASDDKKSTVGQKRNIIDLRVHSP